MTFNLSSALLAGAAAKLAARAAQREDTPEVKPGAVRQSDAQRSQTQQPAAPERFAQVLNRAQGTAHGGRAHSAAPAEHRRGNDTAQPANRHIDSTRPRRDTEAQATAEPPMPWTAKTGQQAMHKVAAAQRALEARAQAAQHPQDARHESARAAAAPRAETSSAPARKPANEADENNEDDGSVLAPPPPCSHAPATPALPAAPATSSTPAPAEPAATEATAAGAAGSVASSAVTTPTSRAADRKAPSDTSAEPVADATIDSLLPALGTAPDLRPAPTAAASTEPRAKTAAAGHDAEPGTAIAGPLQQMLRAPDAGAAAERSMEADAAALPRALEQQGAPSTPPQLAAAAANPAPNGPGRTEQSAPASAPFSAHLSAAIDSPAFAPALGQQVRLLIRDGIQEAQLQLNPAEMGPVEVRITLDGTRAHVEFSADLAATRAAIESSLPELAASLRDSGLTLAGGGVFDQRRGRGEQAPGGQPGGMRNGGADALDEGLPTIAATQAPARSTRGVVDLLA